MKPKVWIGAGLMLVTFSIALKDFQQTIELDPRRGLSYVNRALVYLNQAQLKQAREDLDHAVQLSPKSARTHNMVAWYWATHSNERIRDGRKAVASATRACELTDWKDDGFPDTLAAAYAENGNFDEAVKWQERALELATTEEFKKEYKGMDAEPCGCAGLLLS